MAGEDDGGGGEVLPEAGNAQPAGGPPFWMERLTYDEAYNLVREERLDPQTGQRRDVCLDGPAPELPLWMEYGTYDGAGRVSRVERVDLASGEWRDVSVGRPMPAGTDDDDAGPAGAGRWTIAWGDDVDDPDGPPPPDDHAAAAAAPVELPPAPCPACNGAGTIPLLTSRRPCEQCGGTGKAAS